MNQAMAIEIANAHSRVESIRKLNTEFLAHLAANAQPEGLPSTITIENQVVSITCYDHFAAAKPRFVRDETGLFAVEYVFYTRQGEEEKELWRFYLTDDRTLCGWLDQKSTICDFKNPYVAKHICGSVMHAAIHSHLFVPTERSVG